MSPEEKLWLLTLLGTDDSSIRGYYAYNYLRQIVNAQKKSAADTVFAILTGFTTVVNVLSFYQVPTTAPYILVVSVAFMVYAIWNWLKARQGSKGEEALDKVVRFGIHLDEMRKYSRQLKILKGIPNLDPDLVQVEGQVRKKLSTTLEKLNPIKEKMESIDYFTLGVDEKVVAAEIREATAL